MVAKNYDIPTFMQSNKIGKWTLVLNLHAEAKSYQFLMAFQHGLVEHTPCRKHEPDGERVGKHVCVYVCNQLTLRV